MGKINCAAIIVAAGTSSRMRNLGNKQTLCLCGVPVLIRTISAFEKANLIDKIIVVSHIDFLSEISDLIAEYGFKKVSNIIAGGNSRQKSVSNGLNLISSENFVAVHDGARPFISPEKIDEAVTFAMKKGSAVLGIPLSDTAKIVSEEEKIIKTPDRNTLRLIQTPQVFKTDVLKNAYQKASEDGFLGTDDSSLVERLGEDVFYLLGDYDNIKITTPEDIPRGNAILKSEATKMRVGFGYDVHPLIPNRDLILGGVKIPHYFGLDGHSDADVLIHAIMDALLGAAALGDIGKFFPDNDSSFKNIDSRILLREVGNVLTQNGISINNIDVTLAAQKPKIAPYIEEMRKNISLDLNIEENQVSIKATTTEKLGFEGREEGISAYAVCTIF